MGILIAMWMVTVFFIYRAVLQHQENKRLMAEIKRTDARIAELMRRIREDLSRKEVK